MGADFTVSIRSTATGKEDLADYYSKIPPFVLEVLNNAQIRVEPGPESSYIFLVFYPYESFRWSWFNSSLVDFFSAQTRPTSSSQPQSTVHQEDPRHYKQ